MKKFIFFKSLFLYALLGLCSTACNDDDGHIPMPNFEESACRVTFINRPDEIPEGEHAHYTGLEYTGRGYITRVYQTRDTDDDKILFGYGRDTVVIEAEEYAGADLILQYTFKYTNSLLTTIIEYGPEGEELGVREFKYDSKKRLIEETSGGSPYNYTITYTYDNKDNLTKREVFRGDKLTDRETYENYDSNPTPYAGVKGLPAFYFESYSKNNPGKSTRSRDTNGDGSIQSDETEVITYIYTYNSNGYPTKITETGGKFPRTDTFDYACE